MYFLIVISTPSLSFISSCSFYFLPFAQLFLPFFLFFVISTTHFFLRLYSVRILFSHCFIVISTPLCPPFLLDLLQLLVCSNNCTSHKSVVLSFSIFSFTQTSSSTSVVCPASLPSYIPLSLLLFTFPSFSSFSFLHKHQFVFAAQTSLPNPLLLALFHCGLVSFSSFHPCCLSFYQSYAHFFPFPRFPVLLFCRISTLLLPILLLLPFTVLSFFSTAATLVFSISTLLFHFLSLASPVILSYLSCIFNPLAPFSLRCDLFSYVILLRTVFSLLSRCFP